MLVEVWGIFYAKYNTLNQIYWIIILIFLGFSNLNGQSISGRVTNEKNEAIPYANIYIKTLERGTTTDGNGYYFLTVQPGEYEIIYSSVGYQTKIVLVKLENKEVVQNILLPSDQVKLEEVVIKASKRNPAYEIIRKVMDNRDRYLKDAAPYQCELYIKATETIEKKVQEPPKKQKEEIVSLEGAPIDPFEAAQQKLNDTLANLNLVEIRSTLSVSPPNKFKEERTGYQTYGSLDGLFLPQFNEEDFNFYRNLISFKGISETPIISPFSKTGILAYKYKIEAATEEHGILVYKIKVSPRKKGNSTCSGYVYINEGIWNINRLELSIEKGGLKIYDSFQISQTYQPSEDSTWSIYRQQFKYEEKKNRNETFKGETTIFYLNVQKEVSFPDKFFGNEVASITKEAYERDSTYWNTSRPEKLTQTETKMVQYRDSIEAILTSDTYLDSIDAAFNKVKFGEIVWHGVGFRNHHKKKRVYIAPLPGLFEFELVGGFRVALPYFSYFKRWENSQYVYADASVSMGLVNKDVNGNVYLQYRYDPFHEGRFTFRGGRAFHSINSNDAYLNQLRTSNFILNDRIEISHRRELFNGFFTFAAFSFSDRQSIDHLDSKTFLNDFIDDDSEPIQFEDYQAFITNFRLSYTPGQRYMSEPTRKVILGSNFPTFSLAYRKGWDGPLSSDIDFDYIEAGINQDIILGVLGQSKYSATAGRFINTKGLRYVDFRWFRQSDPYLYSDPLSTFQLLDTSLIANNWFLELHHIHHFNGALVNNIPLVKLLRITAVAGGGFLWVKEDNYRHEEIFGGVERIFKIGPRRRLRVGLFGVIANSNKTGFNSGFKVSFDIIDTWKRDWSY